MARQHRPAGVDRALRPPGAGARTCRSALYYEGDASAAPLVASRGIGDLRFVPKVSIVRGGDAAFGWVLGAAAPVTFPTGDDLALRGSAGVTVEPRLLFGLYPGRLAVVANAGFRVPAQRLVLARQRADLRPGRDLHAAGRRTT